MSGITFDDVKNCARCGCDHERLEFKRLSRPMEFNGVFWSFWASCPTTSEPIMMRLTVEGCRCGENHAGVRVIDGPESVICPILGRRFEDLKTLQT